MRNIVLSAFLVVAVLAGGFALTLQSKQTVDDSAKAAKIVRTITVASDVAVVNASALSTVTLDAAQASPVFTIERTIAYEGRRKVRPLYVMRA